jgi:Ca-activated chloride channel homolog
MKTFTLAIAVFLLGVTANSFAIPQQDREHRLDEIVVTGSFVTQGGAKDVNFLRGEVEPARIPHPSTFTAEGLLSEHSVVIESNQPCGQVFCLVAETIDAELIAHPEARYLIGLGFATNVQSEGWQRRPINLVAVVDKSGSMSGQPLELVRQSLVQVLGKMRDGDQLSIILYGDRAHVHMEPLAVTDGTRATIRQRIAEIQSAGSTALELGLRLGYDVAQDTGKQFDGITRVMLFTDERPNVGNTHAQGFMSMARAGSHQGIGLTTIGVGVQFDAELATTIGSVRGGNLLFMRDEGDVKQVFHDEFDYMVSELAHDLTISITPQAGYNVAGVFGVPDGLLGWQNERTVKVTIPSVFLSSKGGALFVALGKSRADSYLPSRAIPAGATLASIQLQYTPLNSGVAESDRLDVYAPAAQPSGAMQLGHTLIDEFTVLRQATSAHLLQNDQNLAYQQVHALATRLANSNDPRLDNERLLVNALEQQLAVLSGHGREGAPRRAAVAKLWGLWEVRSIQGRSNLRRNERLEFTPYSEFRYYQKEDGARVLAEEDEFDANRRQIVIEGSGQVYDYEVRGNELVLADAKHQNLVFLRRLAAEK